MLVITVSKDFDSKNMAREIPEQGNSRAKVLYTFHYGDKKLY